MSDKRIHISKHQGKMEGFKSISTSALLNHYCNENNNDLCESCYSQRYETFRPQLKNALYRNNVALSKSILKKEDIPKVNDLYFRFNSFGELINETHLINLENIAKANPKTNFGLWSKREDLIMARKKIDNIIYIYSQKQLNNSMINSKIEDFFDKIFIVYNAKGIKEQHIKINCQSKCMECLKCYKKDIPTKIIREKLK